MPAFQFRSFNGRDGTKSWSGLILDMMVDLEVNDYIMHASLERRQEADVHRRSLVAWLGTLRTWKLCHGARAKNSNTRMPISEYRY